MYCRCQIDSSVTPTVQKQNGVEHLSFNFFGIDRAPSCSGKNELRFQTKNNFVKLE